MQLTLNVKLFANFRDGRFSAALREYPEGTRIRDIISELQIPENLIGIIMLNHQHADPLHIVQNGDILALFPLLGGG